MTADEEFDALCFEFGIELDDVVSQAWKWGWKQNSKLKGEKKWQNAASRRRRRRHLSFFVVAFLSLSLSLSPCLPSSNPPQQHQTPSDLGEGDPPQGARSCRRGRRGGWSSSERRFCCFLFCFNDDDGDDDGSRGGGGGKGPPRRGLGRSDLQNRHPGQPLRHALPRRDREGAQRLHRPSLPSPEVPSRRRGRVWPRESQNHDQARGRARPPFHRRNNTADSSAGAGPRGLLPVRVPGVRLGGLLPGEKGVREGSGGARKRHRDREEEEGGERGRRRKRG